VSSQNTGKIERIHMSLTPSPRCCRRAERHL